MTKDYSGYFCKKCETFWNSICLHCLECSKKHPKSLIKNKDVEND